MNAAELIEYLKAFPPETPVYAVRNFDGDRDLMNAEVSIERYDDREVIVIDWTW